MIVVVFQGSTAQALVVLSVCGNGSVVVVVVVVVAAELVRRRRRWAVAGRDGGAIAMRGIEIAVDGGGGDGRRRRNGRQDGSGRMSNAPQRH